MIDKSSNASRLVDKLYQKGLVHRIQSANDRRRVDIMLTDKGIQTLKETTVLLVQDLIDTLNLTPEEGESLSLLLDKIRE